MTLALVIAAIGATAQEKVRVHNGDESYVTEFEYLTFDDAYGDAISVSDLQAENATLNTEIEKLNDKIERLTFNGHDYVDLGLPSGTLWATCNIGATNPENYGDYFAWGDTTGYNSGKTTFYMSTYKYCDATTTSMTKYCTNSIYGTVDNLAQLEDEDDVAVQQWGGNWRMPTYDQLKELKEKCHWVWTTKYNGKYLKGYIVYKKKSEGEYSVANDPHIFLPVPGLREGDDRSDAGYSGYYWSRSLYGGDSRCACALHFGSSPVSMANYFRSSGLSVRAVCPGSQK